MEGGGGWMEREGGKDGWFDCCYYYAIRVFTE